MNAATMTAAEPAPDRRIPARDLRELPEVGRFLQDLGLGCFLPDSLHGFVGRNDVLAGTTTTGVAVLVKRLSGEPRDSAPRMRRLIAYERFAAASPPDALRSPRCLGYDEDERLIAFEYLEGSRSGAELMVSETFTEALAEAVGGGLAALHSTPVVADLDIDDLPPLLPSLDLLEGLPERLFLHSSAAELQAWALLQRDGELTSALHALLESERNAPRVIAHCDLRVDQLLFRGDEAYLIDWEEFRLADAARDLGSFAGEWLYRAMLDIVTYRGDGAEERSVPLHLDARTVRERGVRKLERLRPKVEAFWRGYCRRRHDVQEELATRATAFAGWHLLDRLIAGAANSARLQPVQRAAAGVGRSALLAPGRFVETLGLGSVATARPSP